MSDDFDESDVEAVVRAALGELLNLAAGVAELQTTDESAEEIYAVCDLVAEYYQIERVQAITVEQDDGSYTTHFEKYTGAPKEQQPREPQQPIPGHIRTKGKPKLRLVGTPPKDTDPE